VAILTLHAASPAHVINGAYSRPRHLYVPQSTKCWGAQRRAFEERMVILTPGREDLLYPPS